MFMNLNVSVVKLKTLYLTHSTAALLSQTTDSSAEEI